MNNALYGRPRNEDAPAYAEYYFDLTDRWEDLGVALEESTDRLLNFLKSIPEDKENFRYQPEKWSIKQVVAHMIEAERIFQYRALRFSRFDATELSGFDEDWYAKNNHAEHRSLADIVAEFDAVRQSTIYLFSDMTDEMLDFRGKANGSAITSRSLGWLIIGHAIHHKAFLKERYLHLEESFNS